MGMIQGIFSISKWIYTMIFYVSLVAKSNSFELILSTQVTKNSSMSLSLIKPSKIATYVKRVWSNHWYGSNTDLMFDVWCLTVSVFLKQMKGGGVGMEGDEGELRKGVISKREKLREWSYVINKLSLFFVINKFKWCVYQWYRQAHLLKL